MKICVIGTGTMAKGIVTAFAAKMPVVMKSRTQESLDKAMASISKGYNKLVEKGKITEDAMKAILANITTTTDYADFADADLVIEAAVENMQLKKDVFMELDKICKPETIFATNWSRISDIDTSDLISEDDWKEICRSEEHTSELSHTDSSRMPSSA